MRLLCRQGSLAKGHGKLQPKESERNLEPGQSQCSGSRPTPPSTWGSSKGKCWGGAFPFEAWLIKGAEWARPQDPEDAALQARGLGPGPSPHPQECWVIQK